MAETANESGAVARNLDQADKTQALDGGIHAATEAHGGPEAHPVESTAIGLGATAWVSLAMAVFIGILIWKKVPAVIGGALDTRIAAIRAQLDEARQLRAEAEALRASYEAKLAAAEKDAETMREKAREEAEHIVAHARDHAQDVIVRRRKMAEDKIAAAERAAIADIRARAVQAATGAAATLITQTIDAAADKALIDETIKGLGSVN
jgi:F-type H+-transporting ATPase subunit b